VGWREGGRDSITFATLLLALDKSCAKQHKGVKSLRQSKHKIKTSFSGAQTPEIYRIEFFTFYKDENYPNSIHFILIWIRFFMSHV